VNCNHAWIYYYTNGNYYSPSRHWNFQYNDDPDNAWFSPGNVYNGGYSIDSYYYNYLDDFSGELEVKDASPDTLTITINMTLGEIDSDFYCYRYPQPE